MIVVKAVRASGAFLGNLLTAMIGTTLASEFTPVVFYRLTWKERLIRQDIVSAIVAFGLGCLVYHRWRLVSAKWVWLFGTGLLVLRVLHILPGANGNLFPELTEDSVFDLASFSDWSVFTMTFIRTGFYSCGAFCCWAYGQKKLQST